MQDVLYSELKAYLEESRTQKARESEKLDKITDSVANLATEHQLTRQLFNSKFEMVGHQIAGMNARIDNLEKDNDATGVTAVKELQDRLKEEREGKQYIYKVIIGAMGTLLMMAIGGGATVVWHLIQRHP